MTETTGNIDEIQGLGAEAKELLEATGVENLVSLAESDAFILRKEMEQANKMLELTPEVPSKEEIQSWIDQSLGLVEIQPREQEMEPVTRLEPIEEEVPVVKEILFAIPIPAKHMVKQNIAVNQIPAMDSFVEEDELLRESVRQREVLEDAPGLTRVSSLPPVQNAPKVAGPQVVHIEPKPRVPSDLQPTSPEEREKKVIEPLVSDAGDIRKAPSTGLNAGKTPHSRGYIRGVLHPQPIRIRIAAMISIVTIILIPASLVAGVLLLLEYPLWVAWIPAGFLMVGLLYLMFARGMNCRICGQPIYSPKACRKHVKAHHIRFLGFILPTSIHVLLFSWFRCIYCGTSIRVKE